MKAQPILVGDHFKMPSGSVWKVIGTLPGGKVELFNQAESRFADYLHRQVKTWERVSVNQSEPRK